MDDFSALQLGFTSGLLQAGRHWRRIANAAVRSHGISDASALPLVLIGRSDGDLRQAALAETVGIEQPSLVRLLDQLCAAGLVNRLEDPSDRRAKVVRLTEAGRLLVARIEDDLARLRSDVFADVPAADLEAGLRLFRTLARHVEASGVPTPAEATP